jgi:radical SAM superfamily enzyme YgiQ (UPF0313 family)
MELAPKQNAVVLFYPRPVPGASQSRLPYALLYLERMLRGLNLDVILVDEQQQPDYLRVLEENGNRLLLAGVSAMTGYQIAGGIAFSQQVRKHSRAPIVWGGWHATLLPEQTLREPYVDFVVAGQGERPLRQLVERLRTGRDICDIAGLGFKRGATLCVNPPAPVEDRSSLPSINLDLVDLSKYVAPSPCAERTLNYFTSHGCPFSCAFCSVANVYRHHWHPKPVEQIIQELRLIKARTGIDGVVFDDDNFFVRAEFSRELARAMIEAKLDLKWNTSAHARLFSTTFTDEDLQLFRRAGCRRIYVGAESGDQGVLDVLEKRLKLEDTFRAVEMLKRNGIAAAVSTMVCLPMNPGRDFWLTLNMICRAKRIDPGLGVGMWFYTPYPGTALYETARERGFRPPERLAEWANHTLANFKAPWAPKECEGFRSIFMTAYVYFLNHEAYGRVRNPALRGLAYLLNQLLFSIVRLRVKAKCFLFPVDAILFSRFLRIYKAHGASLKALPSHG